MPNSRPVIRVSAALIVDGEGRMLLVRKRGTSMFMNPGGKPEPGEAPDVALARELSEELGLALDPADFEHLGRFSTDAANEAGHALEAELFRVTTSSAVLAGASASAEIAELAWVHPADLDPSTTAPLVLAHAVHFL